jgi:hypothetical protein
VGLDRGYIVVGLDRGYIVVGLDRGYILVGLDRGYIVVGLDRGYIAVNIPPQHTVFALYPLGRVLMGVGRGTFALPCQTHIFRTPP